jgi:hypothetical protein
MVGGILVEHYGYHVTFLVTASMHITSVLLRTPLLLLVPTDLEVADQESEEEDSAGRAESAYHRLSENTHRDQALNSRSTCNTDDARATSKTAPLLTG